MRDEFEHYTQSSKEGVLRIRSMRDADVLAAARDRKSVAFATILRLNGEGTNPNWVAGACAEEAYQRGLIDEKEFDLLYD